MATRETVDAPWSNPINLGAEINTEANEFAPVLSPDRLTLLFTRYGDPSGKKIFISTRRSLSDEWTTAEPYSLQAPYTPDITADGRSAILVYSRDFEVTLR